jgi:predicted nucleic acid-binding protein
MKASARLLIDSGPIMRQLRGHQPSIQLLRQARGTVRLAISAITRVEVRARMQEYEQYTTQKLLSRFLTYEVDAEIADLAGDLIAHSRTRSLLSLPDAVIAATALVEGLTLITYNTAHFERVRGLRLYSLPEDAR